MKPVDSSVSYIIFHPTSCDMFLLVRRSPAGAGAALDSGVDTGQLPSTNVEEYETHAEAVVRSGKRKLGVCRAPSLRHGPRRAFARTSGAAC